MISALWSSSLNSQHEPLLPTGTDSLALASLAFHLQPAGREATHTNEFASENKDFMGTIFKNSAICQHIAVAVTSGSPV